MMLQQTQAERVVEKYEQFIRVFPDFASLANAPLQRVLEVWQGLGYNRRALYLIQSARRVMDEFEGNLPSDPEVLESFPGIGHATASEIAAFAFHHPSVFIETNIRRVFIHFFFGDAGEIRDREILPLVERTLDRDNPREWYYALMDYGVMLKGKGANPNLRSAHYQKQSPFHGSNRQLRGMILRIITASPGRSAEELARETGAEREAVERNAAQLTREGFLVKEDGRYSIR
jgi:A/G-specific adenine glycosylase